MDTDMIEKSLFRKSESFKAEDYKMETDKKIKLEWLTAGLSQVF